MPAAGDFVSEPLAGLYEVHQILFMNKHDQPIFSQEGAAVCFSLSKSHILKFFMSSTQCPLCFLACSSKRQGLTVADHARPFVLSREDDPDASVSDVMEEILEETPTIPDQSKAWEQSWKSPVVSSTSKLCSCAWSCPL